jgi:hypothetical protein
MRILDQNDNLAPYSQLVIRMSCEGPIEIVGPSVIAAEGGMTGTYVMSAGEPGQVTLTLSPEGLEPIKLFFNVEII